jgi:glycogen operon protein
MFLAGDEFANTQFGNNNAYCQDNIISWLDWNRLEQNQDMYRFFQFMIRLRKRWRVLRTGSGEGACGFPDTSFHGVNPWLDRPFDSHDRYVGVMFSGWERDTGPQVVYVASNAWWEDLSVTLPELPASMGWNKVADTWEAEQQEAPLSGCQVIVRARSVMVFAAK